MLKKIKFGLKIIKEYKTWMKAYLDYLGFLKKRGLKIHKMRNGTKYLFRPRTEDFGIINEIYVVKEYHPLIKYIHKNSIIIDIGAQMGVFSIFAANKDKNVRVYSYEPYSPNFNLLKKNISLNKMSHRILPFKLGVSGKKEKRDFVLCPINTGGHGFYCKDSDKKIKIDTISLKDVFDKNKIEKCDFLKMDCEGAEYEILYKTPKKYLDKIKSISMEYHKNGNIKDLRDFLEKKGFKTKITSVGEGMLYAEKIY
jgi:FkbM family methyltransferase